MLRPIPRYQQGYGPPTVCSMRESLGKSCKKPPSSPTTMMESCKKNPKSRIDARKLQKTPKSHIDAGKYPAAPATQHLHGPHLISLQIKYLSCLHAAGWVGGSLAAVGVLSPTLQRLRLT